MSMKEGRLIISDTTLYFNNVRYDFQLIEDEDNNQFVLDVSCPRYALNLITCFMSLDSWTLH